MADRIIKAAVRLADISRITAEVADFDCGAEVWSVEVSDWLKGGNPDDSVWSDLRLPGGRAWLYYNQGGDLVGVGALGESESTVVNKRVKVPVTVLTNLAVARRFQRVSKGDGEDGYGKQILRDLRASAETARDERPLLTLCVHPDNPARQWYERRGFYLIEPPRVKKTGYYRMALDLHKAPPF